MRYTLKGINSDESSCECCGKQNLNRVMWLSDENENIAHYGTTCGTKLLSNYDKPKSFNSTIQKIELSFTSNRFDFLYSFKSYIKDNKLTDYYLALDIYEHLVFFSNAPNLRVNEMIEIMGELLLMGAGFKSHKIFFKE